MRRSVRPVICADFLTGPRADNDQPSPITITANLHLQIILDFHAMRPTATNRREYFMDLWERQPRNNNENRKRAIERWFANHMNERPDG